MANAFNNPAETALPPAASLTTLLHEYEDGLLTPDQEVQLFQELINANWIQQFPKPYRLRARELILEGRCHE